MKEKYGKGRRQNTKRPDPKKSLELKGFQARGKAQQHPQKTNSTVGGYQKQLFLKKSRGRGEPGFALCVSERGEGEKTSRRQKTKDHPHLGQKKTLHLDRNHRRGGLYPKWEGADLEE